MNTDYPVWFIFNTTFTSMYRCCSTFSLSCDPDFFIIVYTKKYFVHIYWLKNRIKCLFVFCHFLIFFSYIYKIDLNKQVRIVLLFLSPPDTHTQTPLPYETIKYRVWTYFNMTCSVMWHVYLVIWVSFRLSGVLLVSPLFVLDYVPGW